MLLLKNTNRKPKKLWTDNQVGSKISYYRAATEKDEAYFVAKIRDDIQMGKRKYTDFAVLYRTNAQSRMVEEIFLKSNIPYKIVGVRSSTIVKRLKIFWRTYV